MKCFKTKLQFSDKQKIHFALKKTEIRVFSLNENEIRIRITIKRHFQNKLKTQMTFRQILPSTFSKIST